MDLIKTTVKSTLEASPAPNPILEWRRQDGLVVVVLLLLAQDL